MRDEPEGIDYAMGAMPQADGKMACLGSKPEFTAPVVARVLADLRIFKSRRRFSPDSAADAQQRSFHETTRKFVWRANTKLTFSRRHSILISGKMTPDSRR